MPGLGAKGASIASAVCEFVVAGGYMVALTRSHAKLRPSLALLPRAALAAGAGAGALALPLPSVALWAIASTSTSACSRSCARSRAELLHLLLRRSDPDA